MFEVERWLRYEYPSHWSYEDSFATLEDAIEYVKRQNDPSDYRIITIAWQTP